MFLRSNRQNRQTQIMTVNERRVNRFYLAEDWEGVTIIPKPDFEFDSHFAAFSVVPFELSFGENEFPSDSNGTIIGLIFHFEWELNSR